MATRPTPRSRDGARPRSTGCRPSSSQRSSDASRQPARASISSASPPSDKPVPSFLRPTVSSSMHSSSSSPSASPSTSKGARAVTPKRSTDKAPAAQPVGAPRPVTPKRAADKAPAAQPVGAPRPVTPKWAADKAPATQPVGAPRPITPKVDKAKAKAPSTSRWSSVVSPRQLMQKASNAFKATKSRSKKSMEVAGPAASGKEGAGASGETKAETARAQPVEEQHQSPETAADTARAQPLEEQHQPPDTTAEAPPGVQAEEVVELNAAQSEQQDATPPEAVSADIKTEEERCQEELVSVEEPRGDAEKEEVIGEEKIILVEESEAVEVEAPETKEKPQTGVIAETEKEVQKNAEDEMPPAPAETVEAAATESASPTGQDEPATSAVEETVVEETVAEETVAEERQQEESPKPEEVTGNSETSVISEEPKEQPAATENQVEVVAGETETVAALPEPATSLEEALREMEMTPKAPVSSSEPVTPAKEAIKKEKAAIETILLSASAPTTPVRGAAKTKAGKAGSTSMARIPEEAGLTFKGSKVKTVMEKRLDEAQPKKKEVTRSNDVIEEAKSKLLEKRKSKVKALVGAFETVMDSPGRSSPRHNPLES